MPRPITWLFSSSKTALVVVEPRSMPTNVFMIASSSSRTGAGALLLDHLEIAFQPVLDICRGEVARVDKIGFDECRRLSGSLLDLTHDQQLAGREAVAAFDRIDQQAVGFIFLDVVRQHIDEH